MPPTPHQDFTGQTATKTSLAEQNSTTLLELETGHAPQKPVTPPAALSVVDFWIEAGPQLWFAKDDDFDRRFCDRFLMLYLAAARGDLIDWLETPKGSLALLLLLDQFPRNAFRGTPKMYATDAMARRMADTAIRAGHDRAVPDELAVFFYLPFSHSENLADQERAVMLNRRLGEPALSHAQRHCSIVRRFRRFPHRNPVLGRRMTEEEQRFLDEGGFAG
ncbi:DUF924 family protein [uncultured Ferrovibrio sp.]|jgi:uncharacterized protein (DUF924 family)|uniref:DUF924 family protein n=1 Tax=uncultured Ferrovibrio sp. TaxID=1576913 RepID=UPI00262DA295|nr:DUF924 family protein [uncultured Ferrovibrio sp.]